MLTLEEQFVEAQKDVKNVSARPDNETLLQLYAYYKQASQGDVTGERPGSFDFIARAKFEAWSALRGTTAKEAMQRYIELVASLRR